MMERFLTMSGAHLDTATWAWLDTHLQEDKLQSANNRIAAMLKGGATRYGWFVFCPSDDEAADQLPGDLRAVLAHARERGADFVVLERDLIPLDDLPILQPTFGASTDDDGTQPCSASAMMRRARQKKDGLAVERAEQVEETIRRAGSIGELERLAGVGQDHKARYAFWHDYSHLPAARMLDAGTDELKRRIRIQGAR